jgi:tetratricopeptide (TPR) repeat protein
VARSTCLAENTLVAFAHGGLSREEVARIEAHTDTCAACQELLGIAVGTGAVGAPAGLGAGDSLARGATIGRYTILSFLGRGGMGEVYAAYDPELDRKVALKLMRSDGASQAAAGHARLLREAKAMARVSHPNVVAVHDTGTFEGRVFLAMEFVDGPTVRAWLAERPRTRDEVLAVFTQAARGLMAAHAAGLVHRDFKPANMMIRRDGDVRVTDFGLARSLGDSDPEGAREGLPAGGADPGATLTATGQMLGTPRYMAPEQFRAQPTDARTDQFGFCVALYEALYGVTPFGEGSLPALTAAVLAGRVQSAPPKSTVPAWLRRVLLRGLSVAPDDRWPSMRELVAALAQDPARVRRRWSLALGTALLLGVPAFFLARQPAAAALCRGGPARMAGAWEPRGSGASPRRDAVQRAFFASGAPGSKDVWARVVAALDRYAAAWLAAYEDACAATHVRGAQSASLLDLRMACLDDRRTALVALTDVLATADRNAVAKGVDAANALPDLERCSDLAALKVPVEPPRDEAARIQVADLRRRLANAKALNDTGKHIEAYAIERAVVDKARALEYRPVLAEALAERTNPSSAPVVSPDILALTEEALAVALGIGRDDLAAGSAVARAGYAYYFAKDTQECRHWLSLASAMLERAPGNQDRLRSWLMHTEASVRQRDNDLEGALTLMRRALALKEGILQKGHPDIAISKNSEAEILHFMGRNDEALRLNAEVYAIFSAAYGDASGEAAYTLSNRGEYLLDVGLATEALPAFRDALWRWEAHVGTDHQNLAFPTTGIGRALLALDRPQEAVAPLERALRLRDPAHADPELVAETQFALAQALAASSGDRGRAVSLASSALATYRRGPQGARAAVVDAWLTAHPATRSAR